MRAAPLLENELTPDCCHSVLTLGTGNHTRVTPWVLWISTRVVTSKVRQPFGCGLNWRAVFAAAGPADWAMAQGDKDRAHQEVAPFRRERRAVVIK